MTLKVCGVREDKIGVGHHFRGVGIGIDDPWDHVFTCFLIFIRQHFDHAARVHGRVPRHVGHVHEQRVDLVRISRVRVGNYHVHQPVAGHWVFPCEGFVDARCRAVCL